MTREGTKQMTVKSRSHLLDGFNDEDITLRTFNGDHCMESINYKGGFLNVNNDEDIIDVKWRSLY